MGSELIALPLPQLLSDRQVAKPHRPFSVYLAWFSSSSNTYSALLLDTMTFLGFYDPGGLPATSLATFIPSLYGPSMFTQPINIEMPQGSAQEPLFFSV